MQNSLSKSCMVSFVKFVK